MVSEKDIDGGFQLINELLLPGYLFDTVALCTRSGSCKSKEGHLQALQNTLHCPHMDYRSKRLKMLQCEVVAKVFLQN